MKITFDWTSGTARGHMQKALKAHGLSYFDDTGILYTMVHGRRIAIDYRHINGDTYEIVEKVYRFRQEPVLKTVEF